MKEKKLERIYKALANHRRLMIVSYLKRVRQATVGDIAAEIKLSFNATSKHLGILAGVGILDREQKSLMVFYSLALVLPAPAKHAVSIL